MSEKTESHMSEKTESHMSEKYKQFVLRLAMNKDAGGHN
jgi:hypothetical protein